MNEKNNRKKVGVLAGAVVAGIVLAGGIGFGIVNQKDGNSNAVSSPTTSASPTATASAEPTDITVTEAPNDGSVVDPNGDYANLIANPLGLDMETIMAKSLNSDVLVQFPEAEFNVSGGIQSALQHYQITSSVSDLYHARDGVGVDLTMANPIVLGKDKDLIGIDGALSDRIKKELNETGQTSAMWTVPTNGIVKDNNGVEYKVADNAEVQGLDVGRPIIMISDEGTAIVIKADGLSNKDRAQRMADIKETGSSAIKGFGMMFTLPLENGQFYHVELAFYMEIVPTENGEWTITEMGYEDVSAVVDNVPATAEGQND